MIFKHDDTDAQKVHKTREHYLTVLSALSVQRKAMEKAYAFRHGNQWSDDQRSALEEEGRPALTFNLIAPTMREMLGACEDQRREARAAPVGPEDLPTSEAINHLWRRVYEQQRVDTAEYSSFDHAITAGVGFTFIDAAPSDDDPNQLEMTFDAIKSFEVLWDPEASKPNMTDANYFYWSRWMTEQDFKIHYPDAAVTFDEAIRDLQDTPDSVSAMRAIVEGQYTGKISAEGFTDAKFFDRKQKRLRILHLEYKVAERHYYVWDPRPGADGLSKGYGRVMKASYDMAKKSGATPVHSSMGYGWRWFECTGAQALFDAEQPLPIYCSQIHPVTCYYDDSTRQYYGMIRDLLDPQMEFNKRTSQELNITNMQAQPGVIADLGAFAPESPADVERQLKTPGFYLEKVQGKEVLFRDPPQPALAADALAQRSKEIFQVISGVDMNPLLGGQPDQVAVGTAMLAHRKGLLAITPILKNLREFQQKLLSSVVDTIMRGFSDEQIELMLGNSTKITVEDGMVVDKESGSKVSLRELRSVRWNIEMESAAANTTQQTIMFGLLQSLKAAGVPVDPEVFFAYFPGSREERQKLTSYYQQADQQAAQSTQAQQQQQQSQVDNIVKVEAMKIAQRGTEADQKAATAEKAQQLGLLESFVKIFVEAATASKKGENDNVLAMVEVAKQQALSLKTGGDLALKSAQMADLNASRRATRSDADLGGEPPDMSQMMPGETAPTPGM